MALFRSALRRRLDEELGGFWRDVLFAASNAGPQAQAMLEARRDEVVPAMAAVYRFEGLVAMDAAVQAAEKDALRLLPGGPRDFRQIYLDLVAQMRQLAESGVEEPSGPAPQLSAYPRLTGLSELLDDDPGDDGLTLLQDEPADPPAAGAPGLHGRCFQWLDARFSDVYVTRRDAIVVPRMGPTACFTSVAELSAARTRINLHAPVAVAITPTPQLAEYVAYEPHDLAFGELSVHVEDTEPGVSLEIDYSLPGETLTAEILCEFAALIGTTAADLYEPVTRRFGGRSIYEGAG